MHGHKLYGIRIGFRGQRNLLFGKHRNGSACLFEELQVIEKYRQRVCFDVRLLLPLGQEPQQGFGRQVSFGKIELPQEIGKGFAYARILLCDKAARLLDCR